MHIVLLLLHRRSAVPLMPITHPINPQKTERPLSAGEGAFCFK